MRKQEETSSKQINPRFAIINTCDAPCRRMVCQYVPKIGYCYNARSLEPHLKNYYGMEPGNPTSLEDFGFDILVVGELAVFTRNRECIATYEDGKHRPWQDRNHDEQFSVLLVRGPYKKHRIGVV